MAGRVVTGRLSTARAASPFICDPRTNPSGLLFSRKHRSAHGTPHRLVESCRSLHSRCPYRRHVSSLTPLSLPSRAYTGSSRLHREDAPVPHSDAQKRTIYALSTPPGKAGVAVVRISGPDALHVWRDMVKTRGEGKGKARERGPEPWKMHRCSVVHPGSGEVLDDGLAVFFKGPRSFTTEDVLELHVHSGRAIVSSVLGALSFLSFCRPAEPGEFTRRAFEGGRLDLTQVEGLRDLIEAETEMQRKLALRSAEGATRARLESLREEIIRCLALLEAIIDFGESEEIEEGLYEQARERVLKLRTTIEHHLSDNRRGEIMRSGIRLAIFGPPNAGKSSLLNFLAQREAAIVTPVPGTTRDVLELSLDIGGLPVIVADTAGMRQTADVVESIGVDRAKRSVESADVSLCVLSLSEVLDDAGRLHLPADVAPLVKDDTFMLLNKTDLLPSASVLHSLASRPRTWLVSLQSNEGTQSFMNGLAAVLKEQYNLMSEVGAEEPLITHARHRAHLENALLFLDAFLDTPPDNVVFAAEELRYAAQAIGKISGLIDVENVLDAIFRDFCIGK
ncbi:tRNA modification GTPase TrmE [Epithele typhae]|uniref:tRNA modification GTPase TrmE n=1 Tax=Epithele typhae TaxID=378194 RepID=UPI0020088006|nr:tRNA modification GTPase TrmE [Epithele typhae]KAH9942991.1 tRNA modification GTPase TrmE [Epithele typhae]